MRNYFIFHPKIAHILAMDHLCGMEEGSIRSVSSLPPTHIIWDDAVMVVIIDMFLRP